jgi:hypothetical protein
MAGEELRKYPQAFLAQGNGDLVQVQNFNVDLTNNGKQVHTLRRKGAGVVLGTEECTITFDAVIDEDGSERNYWRDCKRGVIRQLRAKVPGGRTTLTCNGIYTKVTLEGPLDAETKVSCTFVGQLEEPQT